MLSFCKWCLKFWIFFTKLNFNIITFMTVIWIIAKKKQKKKQTLKCWKPWIWWIFLLFLVLTRDRNNFETKMSFIQTSELKIHQVQNIRWQLWFEKLKKSKELRYAESFLKCLNFQYEKFIFKLHLRREITTKLKILENMIRLSFWKCFFLELVSLSMAFWRL